MKFSLGEWGLVSHVGSHTVISHCFTEAGHPTCMLINLHRYLHSFFLAPFQEAILFFFFFLRNLCLGPEHVKFKWSQGKLYNWDSHNATFIALKQQS